MEHPRLARPARFRLVAAVHLFLIHEGHVLLLRRANTGYEDGQWSVVVGHLDGDETAQAAAMREVREEVGIELDPCDLTMVGVMQRRALVPYEEERIDFFLTANEWSGTIRNAEPGKCDALSWYPLDGLPRELIPYIRRALDNYRRGVWFDTLGW